MKMLFIALHTPFDGVCTAGEHTFNYYIRQFAKKEHTEVTCVAYCNPMNLEKLDFDKYNIKGHIIAEDIRLTRKEKLINAFSHPFDKYAHKLSRNHIRKLLSLLKTLKAGGYEPDVVVCEFTPIILLINDIKKIFPNSFYAAGVYDIFFQNTGRKVKHYKSYLKKVAQYAYYRLLKRRELDALPVADLLCVQNFKDKKILLDHGINESKIICISPFHKDFFYLKRRSVENDIIIYGSMSREENYLSAIWFIENVFGKLRKEDDSVRLLIVGNNPVDRLKAYESERIVITGYVSDEDLATLFSNARCMVAPLILGSGIKVKILEGFSAALPVVTNEIGIEGIGAVPGQDYLHCEEPQEYIRAILQLRDAQQNKQIGENGRCFLQEHFNPSNSFIEYYNRLQEELKSKTGSCYPNTLESKEYEVM